MLAILLAFTVTTPPTSRAQAAEQVTFSGGGTNNFGAPFAFWIWCAAEGNGPYAQTHKCKGAVTVPVQRLVVHVEGFVVEEADETYTMHVFSPHPDPGSGSLTATLHNVDPEPAHGPNNTVEFTVVTPPRTFTGVSTTAVVNVTGPGD